MTIYLYAKNVIKEIRKAVSNSTVGSGVGVLRVGGYKNRKQ